MEKIAIVILTFNGEKDTTQCLESIGKLQTANYKLQIIVVDNGSKNKFKIQSSKFKVNGLKIIRNQSNLGYAGGNNVGIRYVLEQRSDYILILNNDTIVDKHLIEELVKVAKKDKNIGIVVPKIYFAKGYEFHRDRYQKEDLGRVIWYAGGVMDWQNVIGHHRGVDEVDSGQYDKIEDVDFASGCCLLVKREVFESIGLLDEKYFLYYEDSDFSERAKAAGYKIAYVPQAIIWHKNAGSVGGSGSQLQDYYITRNRLLFGMRHASLRSKVALLKESLQILASGRRWQKRGVLDFYLKRFGQGSYRL